MALSFFTKSRQKVKKSYRKSSVVIGLRGVGWSAIEEASVGG